MQILTARQIRERARRRLGIVTPIQQNYAGAVEGDAPTDDPWPDNLLLDDLLLEVIAELNQRVGFFGNTEPIELEVTAQTDIGPAYLDYGAAITDFVEAYQVATIKNVRWSQDDGASWRPLTPTTFEKETRDGNQWANEPPGLPQKYVLENYSLALLSAPAEDGLLKYDACIGMLALSDALNDPLTPLDTDDDVITQIPTDYQPLVYKKLALAVCMCKPDDLRFQALGKVLSRDVEVQEERFEKWYGTQAEEFESDVVPETYRRGVVRRR